MRSSKGSPAVVLLLLVVALGVGWYMFVRPLGAKAAAAQEQQASAEASLEVLLAGATTTTAPAADDGRPGALAVAVPDGPALAPLLRDLDTVAASTGVQPATLTHNPLVANPVGGGTVSIALTTSGTPEAVDAYVAQLLAMPRLLVVDTVVISESADADGNVVAQLQLGARLFTTASPAVATTAPPTSSL
jgi:hypothetical protein